MAAAEVIGCVELNETDSEAIKLKSNGIDEININGKIHHHKNGYTKPTHISNGISVSRIL